jgi:ubiquinone/menaquinone biosynthesis C-methylase UbiE
MAAALAASSPGLTVVATDADPRMVERAARALAPFAPRARAQQADAAALPFEDGAFDLVISCAMLHHVPDRAKAVAEAVRVLRVGGFLVGYDLLDRAPLRSVHRRTGTPLWRPGALEAILRALPTEDVRTRPALGGLLLRFQATKAPD